MGTDAALKQRQRVSAGSMALIAGVTLLSLAAGVVGLIAVSSAVWFDNPLAGSPWGVAAGYGAVFVIAALSIAGVFRVLVGKAGSE